MKAGSAPPSGEQPVPTTRNSSVSITDTGNSQPHPTGEDGLHPFSVRGKADREAFESLRQLSPSPDPSDRLSPMLLGPYNSPPQPQQHVEPKPSALKRFWANNKPSILVALSQFFGALMNLSARLLELEGDGMHPVQVLLLRQVMTAICCIAYMWWMSTPGFPFGTPGIRFLLLIRGLCGFFGIYGMWYSMMYLPLADATVITFLAPGVAGFLCYFVLREPFTRMERIATFIAFLGVVLIARPTAFFTHSATDPASSTESPELEGSDLPGLEHEATAEERLIAIGVALLGVLGAAGAFTCLRTIGKRAHPLISVTWFAMTCNIICTVILVAAPRLDIDQPALGWRMPTSLWQWCLLLLLGFLGFTMQYLLTSGLAADKSNRANAMIYTHMLFAAAFDRWVFGHSMGLMSFAGCTLILGSAVTVVLTRKPPPAPKRDDVERQGNLADDSEHASMLVSTEASTGETRHS